jgi:hypothetical protein
MRTLVVVTAIAATLVPAGSALAALPGSKASFSGVTSERPINGFRATITFKTSVGGRTMRSLVFQTLGCFGNGAFPVGVDPYAESAWHVVSIPVSATGVFSAKVSPTTTTPNAGKMTGTISGTFTTARAVTGKFVFSQVQSGADCGPKTVRFTAVSR